MGLLERFCKVPCVFPEISAPMPASSPKCYQPCLAESSMALPLHAHMEWQVSATADQLMSSRIFCSPSPMVNRYHPGWLPLPHMGDVNLSCYQQELLHTLSA